MRSVRFRALACLVLGTMFALASVPVPAQAARVAAGIRIEVIEGEDSVNVIQQGTAVAPIVMVKDENDQPVAGAIVTFAIRGGGRATFNGAQTLTVTTNAAGRAAATGLTPTGPGTLQITASASFQGQTATATIAQTNVMTASQAASAAGSGGSGGAGGTGGGGGGMSTTTIGAIAGAGIAGTLVAVKALGGDSGSGGGTSGPGSSGSGSSGGGTSGGGTSGGQTSTPLTLNGTYSGNTTYVWTYSGGSLSGVTCNHAFGYSGTLRLAITQTGASVVGTMTDTRTSTYGAAAINCSNGLSVPIPGGAAGAPGPVTYNVTGTTTSLGFTQTLPTTPGNGVTQAFTGSLSGGVVTGTLTERVTAGLVDPNIGFSGGWTFSSPATLR